MSKRKKDSSKVNNPHDKFFKATFSMPTVVKGYFNEIFPPHLRQKLNLDTLSLDSNSYISKNLAAYYSDLVWKCHLDSTQPIQIAFLFEHKSYPQKFPHFQLLEYMLGMWRKQIESSEGLIPVIPIIVYHGTENWKFEPIENYFKDLDTDFLSFIPRFDYILTDISQFSDESIRSIKTLFLQKTFFAFKHFVEKNFIQKNFVKIWLEGFSEATNEEYFSFIHLLGVYLSIISEVPDDLVFEQLNNSELILNPNAMNAVESIFSKLKSEGKEEGLTQGKLEGKLEGKIEGKIEGKLEGKIEGKEEKTIEIIMNMWEKGHNADFIADCLNLHTQKVIAIIEGFKS